MVDSGFRRGTDVLKAIALGADFVFVGRPFNFANVVAGQAGVLKAAKLLKDEVVRGLGMIGYTSIDQLSQAWTDGVIMQAGAATPSRISNP
jgi:L-lactate dehydrogenase (cytochrome)